MAAAVFSLPVGQVSVNGSPPLRPTGGLRVLGDSEELHVERFVSDQDTVAIQMWAHFTAHRDDPESLFGAVQTGTTFDFHGLIMYRLRADGRFQDIKVAYNKFVRTERDGEVQDLGVPH